MDGWVAGEGRRLTFVDELGAHSGDVA